MPDPRFRSARNRRVLRRLQLFVRDLCGRGLGAEWLRRLGEVGEIGWLTREPEHIDRDVRRAKSVTRLRLL